MDAALIFRRLYVGVVVEKTMDRLRRDKWCPCRRTMTPNDSCSPSPSSSMRLGSAAERRERAVDYRPRSCLDAREERCALVEGFRPVWAGAAPTRRPSGSRSSAADCQASRRRRHSSADGGINGDDSSATTRSASRQTPSTGQPPQASPALFNAHGCQFWARVRVADEIPHRAEAVREVELPPFPR